MRVGINARLHGAAAHVVQEAVLQVKDAVNHEHPNQMPAKVNGHLLGGQQVHAGEQDDEEEDEEDDGEVVEENAVVAAQGAEQAFGGKGGRRHIYRHAIYT